jgi:hypothetical protein
MYIIPPIRAAAPTMMMVYPEMVATSAGTSPTSSATVVAVYLTNSGRVDVIKYPRPNTFADFNMTPYCN